MERQGSRTGDDTPLLSVPVQYHAVRLTAIMIAPTAHDPAICRRSHGNCVERVAHRRSDSEPVVSVPIKNHSERVVSRPKCCATNSPTSIRCEHGNAAKDHAIRGAGYRWYSGWCWQWSCRSWGHARRWQRPLAGAIAAVRPALPLTEWRPAFHQHRQIRLQRGGRASRRRRGRQGGGRGKGRSHRQRRRQGERGGECWGERHGGRQCVGDRGSRCLGLALARPGTHASICLGGADNEQ